MLNWRLLYNRSIFSKLKTWTQHWHVFTLLFYCASLIKIYHALQHANRLVSAHHHWQTCRNYRHSHLGLFSDLFLRRVHLLTAPWYNAGSLDLRKDSLRTANSIGQQSKFQLWVAFPQRGEHLCWLLLFGGVYHPIWKRSTVPISRVIMGWVSCQTRCVGFPNLRTGILMLLILGPASDMDKLAELALRWKEVGWLADKVLIRGSSLGLLINISDKTSE